MTPDAIDLSILRLLQRNGRLTNGELAEAVGLSPSSCSRRVQAMEKARLIAGYHAAVDEAALGHGVTAMVQITLVSQIESVLSAFEAAVARVPAILSCFLMSGEADYLLKVAAQDLEDYERLYKTHLSKLPGVARIQTSFALRKVINRPWAVGG